MTTPPRTAGAAKKTGSATSKVTPRKAASSARAGTRPAAKKAPAARATRTATKVASRSDAVDDRTRTLVEETVQPSIEEATAAVVARVDDLETQVKELRKTLKKLAKQQKGVSSKGKKK